MVYKHFDYFNISILCFYVAYLLFTLFIVQTKALAGAKSFGSFLYSAVNKAGKTVSEASAKIKETVEKNVSIPDSLQRS